MAEGLPRKDPKDQGFGRLHTKREDGNTPLHMAALTGNAGVVRALLEMGTEELEERNTLGQTPLYLAVVSGNNEAVECLVEAGADLTAKAEDGTTIWHAAALAGIRNIKKLLTERTKITTKGILVNEGKTQNSFDSERGEFENIFTNKTTDKNKLNNDRWNLFIEEYGPSNLQDLKRICQIEEDINAILLKQRISEEIADENMRTRTFPESWALSACENIYWNFEEITVSNESEQEKCGSPSYSIICNRSECDTCFKSNEQEDDEDHTYRLSPTKEVVDYGNELLERKMNFSSCNITDGADNENPEELERSVKVGEEKDGNSIDNKNSDIESNKLSTEKTEMKKRRRRSTKRNLSNNDPPQEQNMTSNAANNNENESYESTSSRDINQEENKLLSNRTSLDNEIDDYEVESLESILLDINLNENEIRTTNKPSERKKILVSVDTPKFIKSNQRRNRNRRQNMRKKENAEKDGENENLASCKAIISRGTAFIKHKLPLINMTLGPPVNDKMKRERVCSIMREFFADQKINEVDVSSVDRYGRSLLHHASAAGAVGLVAKLIQAGANVNLPDSKEVTPMLLAALSGSPMVVEILARAGARFDTSSSLAGETPLHIAARHDHHQTIKKLLELGADPNAVDNQNRTPLMMALSHNCTLSGLMLMKNGACFPNPSFFMPKIL